MNICTIYDTIRKDYACRAYLYGFMKIMCVHVCVYVYAYLNVYMCVCVFEDSKHSVYVYVCMYICDLVYTVHKGTSAACPVIRNLLV